VNKKVWLLAFAFILLVQLVLRFPFVHVPLERDEGGYSYMAQSWLAGDIPYRDAFDHKPPLIYAIYAVMVKSFGHSIEAIRWPATIFSLLTTGVFAGIAVAWLGIPFGLAATLLYAIFSGTPVITGSAANSEVFMVLPLLLALWLFLKTEERKNLKTFFLIGLLSGIAVMIKQVALFNFLVFFIFLIRRDNRRWRFDWSAAGWLILGFVVVPMIFIIYFWRVGALLDMWCDVVVINRQYLANVPGSCWQKALYGFSVVGFIARNENFLIWVLGLSGLAVIVFQQPKRKSLLIVAWTLASLVGAAWSGLFFGHYFIPVIPGLCLLTAYAWRVVQNQKSFWSRSLIWIISLILLLVVIPFQWPFYLKYSPEEISTCQYGTPSFALSWHVSKYLQAVMKPGDSLLVWSAQPELYFYLNKKSPTRYYNYLGWMASPTAKKEVSAAILAARPNYIVWTHYAIPHEDIVRLVKQDYQMINQMGNWLIFKRKG